MQLTCLGWNSFFEQAWAQSANGLPPARVVTETRGFYQAWAADGIHSLQLAGSLKENRPVTGDWVAFDPQAARIEVLLPRRTKVSRKKAGRAFEEQVLAANVDVLLLVNGLDQDFSVRRLERYLLLAHESGARPVIVLNKSDLCANVEERVRLVRAVALEAPIVVMSAREATSVAQLHAYVHAGETAVVLGSSGVGKSTITNQLLGCARQATGQVRAHDHRGQHTTRTRQMFLLEQGWLLIDTPGIRELEPWASTESATYVFRDIYEAAANCRFRDCRHQSEPGCAVREAVSCDRLAAFHKLMEELAELERRMGKLGRRS
ncbi:MAG: ribosome small subunit-dependent GTPase A [Bryobacteraceae bacterium]|nr:ribosome small subunit-dependent GTPase A [Bryobacteraceae bacterium]MDW8377738.1 ribosome small subunit-dependent GTPase A [Bryobacterales bacterium]